MVKYETNPFLYYLRISAMREQFSLRTADRDR